MEKKKIITIGGLPGSGKTTARTLLAEKLGYEQFSTGSFTRKLAAQRGMTLEELNEQIAGDKELDRLIDAELERIAKEEDEMVIDSHLAFHFIPEAFNVYLKLSPEVSAERIYGDRESTLRKESGDSMESLDEAVARTKKRIENHKDRYLRHYNLDPYEPSQFDLVVDTEKHSPEEVIDIVERNYRQWLIS